MPLELRASLGRTLHVDVTASTTSNSGFSVGFAGVIGVGRDRVFVKAADAAQHPHSAALHRREATVISMLPEGHAPTLLAALDDHDWVLLATDFIDGTSPGEPWNSDDLDAVLAELHALGGATAPNSLKDGGDELASTFKGWSAIRDLGYGLTEVPSEIREGIDLLCEMEGQATRSAAEGGSIVHCDVRGDNVVVDRTGRARLVDWAHAIKGAPWVDVVLFAPSVEGDGGPTITETFQRYFGGPLPQEVVVLAAGWAGLLHYRSLLPEPSGLVGLRRFQARQAIPAMRWLASVL